MKRTDLLANTTYAVRRADDAVVPARLLDSVNIWSPLLDSDQEPTDDFRVRGLLRPPLPEIHRRVGLLMIVLNTPKPPNPLQAAPSDIERYARGLDALPPLGPLERNPAGLRAWRTRAADVARVMPLKTDVVPNQRILHLWGRTPSVTCPGCGRAGWVLDGEGRLPTHDFAPPLRAVCSFSGAVIPGAKVGT